MEAVSVDQFVQLLAKSEVLPPEKMKEVEEAAPKAKNSEHLARSLMRQGLLTPWQAGQLLIGRSSFMMGKYRRIDLLGKGGMGTVFLAEHVTMNRRVALKILPKGMENNPAAMERFMAEARAIATVDHPNIVQAYSVDNEAGQYYMVMEYVDGRDLERIVTDGGPLDYAHAADYVRQAALGLAHAHSRGMIHCDIKPSNLLVNSQGVVKILDLGLARLADDDKSDEAAKANEHILGTVDYMAPEQGLNAKSFDHRADIYSLGCTLYFLLTGQPPFPEGTLAQRIVKHQTQNPASILEKRPDAPPQLVRICRKMMAKAPKDRYQSADDVVQALSELNLEQRLKRAVPLDQVAADHETAQTDNQVVDGTPPKDTPEVAAEDTVVVAARHTRASGPAKAASVIMWGVILLVIALIGTGVAAVVMLTKTSPAEPSQVAQPAPKAPDEPRPEAAAGSSFPSLNPSPAPDTKPPADAKPAPALSPTDSKQNSKTVAPDAKTPPKKTKKTKAPAGTKPAPTQTDAKNDAAAKKEAPAKKESDAK
jgi:serine/threonine protein kinase